MNTFDETIPRQPEQLAYVAGLFDGEGCICILPTRHVPTTGANFGACRYTIDVTIQMCDEGTIRWLCDMFQGRLVHSRLSRKNPKLKDSFQFHLKEQCALGFLRLIYPYLRVKKREAALLFKFYEVKRQIRYKQDAHRAALLDEMYWEMKSYKRQTLSSREKMRKNQGAVETERSAPSDGVKFQSELTGDGERATLVTA